MVGNRLHKNCHVELYFCSIHIRRALMSP
ncbi:unnamed protein product [Spirodela intermedia]|uniref:Uncharacterized protein n=2 Tax=Spirodela intermedia TaxID=51605 RepID=A0A7I8L737_SPIIN|nr:unnamed protein product [Spirodela intermedia]CAA7405829.1 unnamed protein product [Spirodela intermedia]